MTHTTCTFGYFSYWWWPRGSGALVREAAF